MATSAATCGLLVLGLGFGSRAASPASADAAREARSVTVRFFDALDRGDWNQACSLLARRFYRSHHVTDRRHCVAGLRIGMGGTAVRYRIAHVDANGNGAVVHAVVDGAPGTVRLIREQRGFRILELHATGS